MVYDAVIMSLKPLARPLKELAIIVPFVAWAAFLAATDHGLVAIGVGLIGVLSAALADMLGDDDRPRGRRAPPPG